MDAHCLGFVRIFTNLKRISWECLKIFGNLSARDDAKDGEVGDEGNVKGTVEHEDEVCDEEGEEAAPEDDPGGEETKSGCHPTVKNLLSADLRLFIVHCSISLYRLWSADDMSKLKKHINSRS